jgi:hypothetical protein
VEEIPRGIHKGHFLQKLTAKMHLDMPPKKKIAEIEAKMPQAKN